MAAKTRNISTLIESQLPGFIIEDYGRFKDFIEKYYEELEFRGKPLDILHNITTYRDIDFYTADILKEKTVLVQSITDASDVVHVEDAAGFPDLNGYFKIDDEICYYEEKLGNTFLGVKRGVSGNHTLGDLYNTSEFSSTEADAHRGGAEVLNISNLFLYAIVSNFEKEFLAGFPENFLKGDIDKRTLIKNIADFYKAKGTDRSIKFLFNTIISQNPDEEVFTYAPKDFTLKPSTSDWTSTYSLKVKIFSGTVQNIIGNIIKQGNASAVVDSIEAAGGANEYILNLAPETVVGEFEITASTELKKDVRADAVRGQKITVFSTQGFSPSGTLIIDNRRIDYSQKNVSQFTIFDREAQNLHIAGTRVYSDSVVIGEYETGQLEFVIEGIVYNLLPNQKRPYAQKGDPVQVTLGGFESSQAFIQNRTGDVRWYINTNYDETNSIHPNIQSQLDEVLSDVTAIYEDEQYYYICSSSFPSYQDLLTVENREKLQDQRLLKIIRKFPTTTTEVYETSTRDVGVLVDGTPIFSYKDEDHVLFGKIIKTDVVSKGGGYSVPPKVLINEVPNLATAILGGDLLADIKLNDDTIYTETPTIRLTAGEGAKVTPIVTNGEITSIQIDDPGKFYVTPPRIVITDVLGRGSFAEYETEINNAGELINCIKINGGKFYDGRFVSATVEPIGNGARATATIRKWVKDRYRIEQNNVDINNGFAAEAYDPFDNYGYAVLANPRNLRLRASDSINTLYEETPFGTSVINGITYDIFPHSPILGYAYDGNPIYGPYGHIDPLDPSSSNVRLRSGYQLKTSRPEGPSTVVYPLGTFIDDYEWVPSVNSEFTELDVNNGRFCVTPDYPEGVYAYFMTMTSDQTPVFPYMVGQNFYSLPVDSNYNAPLTQSDLPKNVKRLNVPGFVENGEGFTGFVNDVTKGSVSSVTVEGSGNYHSVGSLVLVDPDSAFRASVDAVEGQDVLSIESQQTKASILTTSEIGYFFDGDEVTGVTSSFDIVTGFVVGDVVSGNTLLVRDITTNREFSDVQLISGSIEVQKFIIAEPGNYTKGATISLVDIEAQAIVAEGEILDSVVAQNSILVRINYGVFETGDEYYIKSSVLADTSRSELIDVTSLSTDIPLFSVEENIAILQTNEPHGLSVDEKIDVTVIPDEATTETTYFVRKKLYQDLTVIPVQHNSVIVDTGVGSADVVRTGNSYFGGIYEDVELIFQDQTLVRDGLGRVGDPNNAKARIEVTDDGNGFGPIRSVTITSKGAGYRKEDRLTIQDTAIGIIGADPQRLLIVVDHVGFAATNNLLFLSNVSNISTDDFLQIGDEIVQIEGVNIAQRSATVIRGQRGTRPVNHYDGNPVKLIDSVFRFEENYRPSGTAVGNPFFKSYDPETNEVDVMYDYGVNLEDINEINVNSVFFDQSTPAKIVTLSSASDTRFKLELSKGNEDNFVINPSIDAQKLYSYKFDTSHFSMAETFLDISPSINYNIFTNGKETSIVAPGSPNSFTKIKFGFSPDIEGIDQKQIELQYSSYYYFIKASGVDTEGAKLNIINDPLAGVRKIIYRTLDRVVYKTDFAVDYDGSGEMSYTTSSINAVGAISSVSIENGGSAYTTIPVIAGATLAPSSTAILKPEVINGKITSVSVENAGKNYVNPVAFVVGKGTGAFVRVNQVFGAITTVELLQGGNGYDENTTVQVLETNCKLYAASKNIGLPKNVTITNKGRGFTNDFTTRPQFSTITTLVLTDIEDGFKSGTEITQPFTGAKAKVSRANGFRVGTNLLRIEDIQGEFITGYPIIGKGQAKEATVSEILVSRFDEDIRFYDDKTGKYVSDKGKIGVGLNKIHDSYFYQDFSYVVDSETTIDKWRDLILDTTHPAGFELFGEVNIESADSAPMPEADKGIESLSVINVSVPQFSTLSRVFQSTITILKFSDINLLPGRGGIDIQDINLQDIRSFEVVLDVDFDGDLDPDTSKRIGTDTFQLSDTEGNVLVPYNEQGLVITLDGIIQEPGESYVVTGNQITFAEPPLGVRIAEGQEVPGQKFYGKYFEYQDVANAEKYLKKIKNISDQFDNRTLEFDLYYEDNTVAKTGEDEDLLVVINGVKQVYGTSYTIKRYEDALQPDRIVFTEAPKSVSSYYDSEDDREDDVLRLNQTCFIYSIGNYFVGTIATRLLPERPKGPFNIVNTKTGLPVNVPDPDFALVFLNNILQVPGEAYTISGSMLFWRNPVPFAREADGTLLLPNVEVIYLYGDSLVRNLSIHNFEPETYYRFLNIEILPDPNELDASVQKEHFEGWRNAKRAINDIKGFEWFNVYERNEEEEIFIPRAATASVVDPGEDYGFGLDDNTVLQNIPTQEFTYAVDPVTYQTIIDGVTQAPLTLIPGNTYRFKGTYDLSPQFVYTDTGENVLPEDGLTVYEAETFADGQFFDLIIKPDFAFGRNFRIVDPLANDFQTDGSLVTLNTGAVGSFGDPINANVFYAQSVTGIELLSPLTIYEEGWRDGNLFTMSTAGQQEQGEDFVGQLSIPVVSTFTPNPDTRKFIGEKWSYTSIGEDKLVISVWTDNAFELPETNELVLEVVRDFDNKPFKTQLYGKYIVNITEADLNVDDVPRLERKVTSWLGDTANDKAYYKRTKALANIHPKDKIYVSGEYAPREVLEVSRYADRKEWRPGVQNNIDIFANIVTTPYAGPTTGNGVNITCEIDGEGRVTDLTLYQPDIVPIPGTVSKISPVFPSKPEIYFVPVTQAGGGAKADVLWQSGQIKDIRLLNPGYGYERPPRVVIAKPYLIKKDPDRVIDSFSIVSFNLQRAASLVSIFTEINANVAQIDIEGIEVQVLDLRIEVDQDQFTVILELDDYEGSIYPYEVTFPEPQPPAQFLFFYGQGRDAFDIRMSDTRDIWITSIVETLSSTIQAFNLSQPRDAVVDLEFQIVVNDAFIGAKTSQSDILIPLESDFLEGDTVLYVTSTDNFPDEGFLEVGLETVEYEGKEDDRFFIVQRGARETFEQDTLVPNYVRFAPDLLTVLPVEIEQGLFDFFAQTVDVGASTDVRRFITSILTPESQRVSIETANSDSVVEAEIYLDLFLDHEFVPLIVREIQPLRTVLVEFEQSEYYKLKPIYIENNIPGSSVIEVDSEVVTTIYGNEETLNLTIVDVKTETQQGSIIVVPGFIVPVEIEIDARSPVFAGLVELNIFLSVIDIEEIVSFDTPRIRLNWIRNFWDNDTLVPIPGTSVIGTDFSYRKDRNIFTTVDQAAENPVSPVKVTLDITSLPARSVEVDPDTSEEIISFTYVVEAPLGIKINWIRNFWDNDTLIPIPGTSVISVDTNDQLTSVLEIESTVTPADTLFEYVKTKPIEVTRQVDITDVDRIIESIFQLEREAKANVLAAEVYAEHRVWNEVSDLDLSREIQITKFVFPVEQVTIQGVLSDVVGPEIVEVESDEVISEILLDVFAGDNLERVEYDLTRTKFVDVENVLNSIVDVSPAPLGRVIQPVRSVPFDIVKQVTVSYPTNEDFGFLATLISPQSTSFEVFFEREDEVIVDSTVFSSIEQVVHNDTRIFTITRQIDFQITKQITRWYPNYHYLRDGIPIGDAQGQLLTPGGDGRLQDGGSQTPDPDEGLLGQIPMPLEQPSAEFFFTATIPGPSDDDEIVDFQLIVPRNVALVRLDAQYVRTIQPEIEVPIEITKQITKFFPRFHIDPATGEPDAFQGLYGEVQMPAEQPSAEFFFTATIPGPSDDDDVVDISELEITPREVTITLNTAQHTRIIIPVVEYADNFDVYVEPLRVYIETGSDEELAVELVEQQVTTQVEMEREVKQITSQSSIVTQLFTGIADGPSDDYYNGRYLSTTLGPTTGMFERNQFLSNGSLDINASIWTLGNRYKINDFDRPDSSYTPDGAIFNLGIPSINELGTQLAAPLLIGETTMTVTTVLDKPLSLWPTTGTLIIGNSTNETLEIIEYTGISGNTFTGVVRGAQGTEEVAHAVNDYMRTIG